MRMPRTKTQTLNDDTFASNPGMVTLSHAKLRRLQPELYLSWMQKIRNPEHQKKLEYFLTHVEEHLSHGDSRAAVVVSTQPFLVAAYTDELDCVVLLQFPQELVPDTLMRNGTRLLTVNTYDERSKGIAPDLKVGPGDLGRWGNFMPFIAEFLSEDDEQINTRKKAIGESEWQRTEMLGREALCNGVKPRNGEPMGCVSPSI